MAGRVRRRPNMLGNGTRPGLVEKPCRSPEAYSVTRPFGRFRDHAERHDLIAKTKRLHAQGVRQAVIAERLGVGREFVKYHTMTDEQRQREREGRRERRLARSRPGGVRTCVACGDERQVSAEYMDMLRAGLRRPLCSRCANRRVTPPELEPVGKRLEDAEWAWQVWSSLSPSERKDIREWGLPEGHVPHPEWRRFFLRLLAVEEAA